LSHSIHQRAQLGVYLRLNNIPVPSISGPSAAKGNWVDRKTRGRDCSAEKILCMCR
jgi:hypothetical protein